MDKLLFILFEKKQQKEMKLMQTEVLQKLRTIYIFLSIAAAIQVTGGIWDGMIHLTRPIDSFFTFTHMIVYGGVGLGIVATLAGFFFLLDHYDHRNEHATWGIKLALVGSALWLFGGPFDYWWHQNLTQESFLITPLATPSHIVFETGIIFFIAAPLVGFCCLTQNYLYRITTPYYDSFVASIRTIGGRQISERIRRIRKSSVLSNEILRFAYYGRLFRKERDAVDKGSVLGAKELG